MTDFADEARTRRAHMLRMAAAVAVDAHDERVLRARIFAHTDHTPEPPAMASYGVSTQGCPKCERTMWHQRDRDGHYWVCASCGHVEAMVMVCPQCAVEMKPPPLDLSDRWVCPLCGRAAGSGESGQEIEEREAERQEALRLLDAVIAQRRQERDEGGESGGSGD